MTKKGSKVAKRNKFEINVREFIFLDWRSFFWKFSFPFSGESNGREKQIRELIIEFLSSEDIHKIHSFNLFYFVCKYMSFNYNGKITAKKQCFRLPIILCFFVIKGLNMDSTTQVKRNKLEINVADRKWVLQIVWKRI